MSEQNDQRGRQGDAGPAGREGVAGVAGAEGRPGRSGEPGHRGERGPRAKMRWAPAVGYVLLAVAGLATALFLFNLISQTRELIDQNRELIDRNKQLIDQVAKDCVDRDGDLSYRHVIRGLIRMDHNRNPFTDKPMPANITPAQRQALTAELLQRGLDEAGPVPPCINAGAG